MSQMYELSTLAPSLGDGAAAAPSSGGERHPELANVTILIVDDEPMMSEVTQTYLEEAGYRHFVQINDPHDVIGTARRVRPGLILLDLMMPGLNGFEVLEQLRLEETLRYTPVIVLTAATDPASKLRALELGASEFLAKPVDETELRIRVRNSLIFKVYQDRLANDDPLTGLPNRRVYVERLHAALVAAATAGQRLAMLQINLDRFRQVNDTLGHASGDALLKVVAQRLKTVARDNHPGLGQRDGDEPFLARVGGDEFALLLPWIAAAESADRVARAVLQVLGAPFAIDGQDLYCTASIGISVYPDDGEEEATLMINAGTAMRHAKDSGRNTSQFYSADLNHVSVERLQLESDLRRALERDELVLHYQPKVDLRTRRITGAEALIRWQHPQRGMIPPIKFIPIAEETGLIVEIGEWVVHEACAQIARWRRTHGFDAKVAVNVARPSLANGNLPQVVQGALDAHGVPVSQLVLELTESMLMDKGSATAKLHELRALGVELSIDDFGTGYSSMSYLKQFPVQELKIDRSFVVGTPNDATDVAIVRALVVLGHSLGMRVVAEGVEEEAQREALGELGCDQFQGYLCSKPLPADAFAAKWFEINGAASPVDAAPAAAGLPEPAALGGAPGLDWTADALPLVLGATAR